MYLFVQTTHDSPVDMVKVKLKLLKKPIPELHLNECVNWSRRVIFNSGQKRNSLNEWNVVCSSCDIKQDTVLVNFVSRLLFWQSLIQRPDHLFYKIPRCTKIVKLKRMGMTKYYHLCTAKRHPLTANQFLFFAMAYCLQNFTD